MSIAAAAVCVGAHAASGDIAVTIAPEKRVLQAHDDVVVNVTFTNVSAAPQYLLKWQTPFEGEMEEPLFEVRRDGVKVGYLGPVVKRPAPEAGDYYVLQPGKSYSRKVELSAFYDMSATGNYTVRYHTKSLDLFGTRFGAHGAARAERPAGELQSETAAMWIDGRLPRGAAAEAMAAPTAAAASLSFSKCTSSQAATVTDAVSAATAMASDGDAYLAAGKTGPRYTTWFGTVTSARYNKVKANFAAIKDAFLTKPITVDCGCKKRYYAYVYPNQPYKIYVCRAFWSAPMTGTDSKGGTLVHEMSHFNAVAGTDDWVYGQAGAKQLAISEPDKAVENADSHEYFAENTPPLQ
ncbi:MAG TPA: M35 family metallo-endopeptidase [Paucimonas sp.]|nr:M35 family metallo-endopeptidase [Paucimonas sp.]